MKCAICKKPVQERIRVARSFHTAFAIPEEDPTVDTQERIRAARSFHTACAIANNARTKERADVVAFLRAGGDVDAIERGEHVGAAGKAKS